MDYQNSTFVLVFTFALSKKIMSKNNFGKEIKTSKIYSSTINHLKENANKYLLTEDYPPKKSLQF